MRTNMSRRSFLKLASASTVPLLLGGTRLSPLLGGARGPTETDPTEREAGDEEEGLRRRQQERRPPRGLVEPAVLEPEVIDRHRGEGIPAQQIEPQIAGVVRDVAPWIPGRRNHDGGGGGDRHRGDRTKSSLKSS